MRSTTGKAPPPTPAGAALRRRWLGGPRSPGGLKVRVLWVIKNAIVARELLPGDVISERELEQIFRVSRIPVREALKLLEGQGWLVTLPRRGTRIQGLDLKDIYEIYQLRERLEPLAAQLAAKAMTAAAGARFRRILAVMERCLSRNDLAGFIKQDLAVHTSLARLSGNSRLEAIITGLGEHIRRLGTYSISASGRDRASLEEHRALFRALRAGSGEEAARRMAEHLVNTRDTVLHLIAARGTPGAHINPQASMLRANRPLRHHNRGAIRTEGG